MDERVCENLCEGEVRFALVLEEKKRAAALALECLERFERGAGPAKDRGWQHVIRIGQEVACGDREMPLVVSPCRGNGLEGPEGAAIPLEDHRAGRVRRGHIVERNALRQREERPLADLEMAPLLGGERGDGLKTLEAALAPFEDG